MAKIHDLPSFRMDEAQAMAKALEPVLSVTYRQLDEMEAQGVDAGEIRALRALALYREGGVAAAVGGKLVSPEQAVWYDRAIKLFKKSNNVVPSAECYLLMGNLLRVRGRADEGLAALREAERRGTGNVKRLATEAIKQNRPWWRFW